MLWLSLIDWGRYWTSRKVTLTNIRVWFYTEKVFLFVISRCFNPIRERYWTFRVIYCMNPTHNFWLQILARALFMNFLGDLNFWNSPQVPFWTLFPREILLCYHFNNLSLLVTLIFTALPSLFKHLRLLDSILWDDYALIYSFIVSCLFWLFLFGT